MEKLVEIINEWDPMNLFPMAPEDEYIDEIEEIYNYIHSEQEISSDILAKKLDGIFRKAFSVDNVYGCKETAQKILEIMDFA